VTQEILVGARDKRSTFRSRPV